MIEIYVVKIVTPTSHKNLFFTEEGEGSDTAFYF